MKDSVMMAKVRKGALFLFLWIFHALILKSMRIQCN